MNPLVKEILGASATIVEPPSPLHRVVTEYIDLTLRDQLAARLAEIFGSGVHDVAVGVIQVDESHATLLCRAKISDSENPSYFEHEVEMELNLESGQLTG